MDIKINADMNGAIDQIAEKLGTTAKDIIPKYTKLAFVQGVVWTAVGTTILAAPWILLPHPDQGEQAFFVWLGRGLFSIIGIMVAASSVEGILAPDAVAIQGLIKNFTKGDD